MAFVIQASDQHGVRSYGARSAREAIDMIADLLNADFRIDRLTDSEGELVDYDHIAQASLVRLR